MTVICTNGAIVWDGFNNPSVCFADSSLYTREPWGVRTNSAIVWGRFRTVGDAGPYKFLEQRKPAGVHRTPLR